VLSMTATERYLSPLLLTRSPPRARVTATPTTGSTTPTTKKK